MLAEKIFPLWNLKIEVRKQQTGGGSWGVKGEAAKIHVFGFLCFLKLSYKIFTHKYVVLSILNM